MINLTIEKNEEKQRLDRYLKKYLNNAPANFIQMILRKKYIKVNGKREKGEFFLSEGDVVSIYLSDETLEKFRKEKTYLTSSIKLDIVYEDSNILLLNKPEGIEVQPSEKNIPSLIDAVLENISYDRSNTFRPSICNRLDRNTTGLVIVAKNYEALKQINNALRQRLIKKTYTTIVFGKLTENIEIKTYLSKEYTINKVSVHDEKVENSKEAKTIIYPLCSNEKFTEIEVDLITGKTHQIRAHLEHIGHPLIGDSKYGGSYKELKYQLLHAFKIEIEGMSNELTYLNGKIFKAPLPKKYVIIRKKIFEK
jgi:23S rRNA pseudouridine955/2504/2580 synthase